MKKPIKWLVNTLLALLIMALLLLLLLPLYLQERAAVVLSSSMEPNLPRGALAFTRAIKPAAIKVGDIIAFSDAENSDITISHRVVEIITTEGELFFQTKGDANEDLDTWLIPAEYVRGKVIFHVPRLGRMTNYALLYVKTWPGLVFLIILPSVILIGGVIYDVAKPRNRRQKHLDLIQKRRQRLRKLAMST